MQTSVVLGLCHLFLYIHIYDVSVSFHNIVMEITIQPLSHAVICPGSNHVTRPLKCDMAAPLISVVVPSQRCSCDERCSSNVVDRSRRAVANLTESILIKSMAASIQYGHFHLS